MNSTRIFENEVPQKIKFKSSIIEYILEHISHKHLLKLYLTCKYFPNQFSLIIFDKLIVYVKSEYVVCEDVKYPLEYFSKIWTVNEICLYGSRADHSLWMSKAYISTLNKLVANGTLSLKDFKFLIQNDMVEDIEIDDIKDENGKFLSVEEIISLVPNAYVIALFKPHITPETFRNLALMKRNTKMSHFALQDIKEMITTGDILNIIKVHASNIESYFNLTFDYRIPEKHISSLHSAVKCKIFFEKEFKTFSSRPSFYAGAGSYMH